MSSSRIYPPIRYENISQNITVGYSGSMSFDSGFIYTPYIPLEYISITAYVYKDGVFFQKKNILPEELFVDGDI